LKILIYDITITGHHSEYINHLVNYIDENSGDDNQYYFIVHPEFSKRFAEISGKATECKNITWLEISNDELEQTLKGSLVKRSFSNFKLLNKYAKKYQVDHVLLLYLNTFQFALIFAKRHYIIDGILFRQFYRMRKSSLKQKVNYWIKYLLLKLVLKNSKIRNLYILNDEKSVSYFNRIYNSRVFRVLKDPIPNILPKEDFRIKDYHNIGNDKRILLHFGSLSDRKGTLEILDAVLDLNEKISKKICLLIIGKANSEFRRKIVSRINRLKIENPSLTIVYRDEFVSNCEMKCYFEQSDFLLIPYKNIESSSGILGHAISSETPVLSVNKGLIEDIVLKYQAGVLIDEVTPFAVKSGIEKLLSTNTNILDKNEYIETHSPKVFSEALLN